MWQLAIAFVAGMMVSWSLGHVSPTECQKAQGSFWKAINLQPPNASRSMAWQLIEPSESSLYVRRPRINTSELAEGVFMAGCWLGITALATGLLCGGTQRAFSSKWKWVVWIIGLMMVLQTLYLACAQEVLVFTQTHKSNHGSVSFKTQICGQDILKASMPWWVSPRWLPHNAFSSRVYGEDTWLQNLYVGFARQVSNKPSWASIQFDFERVK